MTRTKFFIFSFLKSFGINFTTRRLTEATHELFLMKDGEELLGYSNWMNCENLIDLQSEYWDMKNLSKRRDELVNSEDEIREKIQGVLQTRSKILDASKDATYDLSEELKQLKFEHAGLLADRQRLFNQGKQVRKNFEGLKMREKFYKENNIVDEDEKSDLASKMEKTVAELQSLKEERDVLIYKIEKAEESIELKQAEIAERRSAIQMKSYENYADAGVKNQDLSSLKNEVSSIDEKMGEHYRTVGKYLFANRGNEEVKKAIQHNKQVLFQLIVLRKSIHYNHRLSGRIENKKPLEAA